MMSSSSSEGQEAYRQLQLQHAQVHACQPPVARLCNLPLHTHREPRPLAPPPLLSTTTTLSAPSLVQASPCLQHPRAVLLPRPPSPPRSPCPSLVQAACAAQFPPVVLPRRQHQPHQRLQPGSRVQGGTPPRGGLKVMVIHVGVSWEGGKRGAGAREASVVCQLCGWGIEGQVHRSGQQTCVYTRSCRCVLPT